MPATSGDTATAEEDAILGLRAQILDNLRVFDPTATSPVIATRYDSIGWTVLIFVNAGGPLLHSTLHPEPTVVAALRKLLQYTSERVRVHVRDNVRFPQLTAYHIYSAGFQYPKESA